MLLLSWWDDQRAQLQRADDSVDHAMKETSSVIANCVEYSADIRNDYFWPSGKKMYVMLVVLILTAAYRFLCSDRDLIMCISLSKSLLYV